MTMENNLKMYLLLKNVIFQCHVSFLGGVHGNTLDLAPRMHQDDHIFLGYAWNPDIKVFICHSYWVGGGVDPRNTSSFIGGGRVTQKSHG